MLIIIFYHRADIKILQLEVLQQYTYQYINYGYKILNQILQQVIGFTIGSVIAQSSNIYFVIFCVLICSNFYCRYFIEYDTTLLWVTAGYGHTTVWVRYIISHSSWAIYTGSILLLSFPGIQGSTTLLRHYCSSWWYLNYHCSRYWSDLWLLFILDGIAGNEATLFHKFQAVRQTANFIIIILL